MVLFGHLAYCTMTETGIRAVEGKKTPVIGKRMLQPVLVEPAAGASPVGRDPFEVDWSSYLGRPEPATRPTSRPASRPTTAAATRPAGPTLPALPKRLTAAITAQRLQMAIIDECLYRPGALIGGTDALRCWRVETIERDRVTLRFGDVVRTLMISKDAPPADPSDGSR